MTKVSSIKILLLLFASILIGCEDFDNYSTNPNHTLRFSVDTLSFDTVFTTIGSATKQFVIYNPNDDALKIESVQLANASKSGFRINVDGRKGDQFKDIDIWGKDSLYVMVEVTVDPNGKNQPLIVEDSIMFYTNGIRQSILLQAYGQDVHLIKGGVTYDKDTRFTADKPYLIYDSIMVGEGATLTIDEGATLYMHNKASLIVSGTLKAKGAIDKPIVIRGDRLDSFQANIVVPYDRVPGQWGGIYFTESSFDNEFDYVFVRNGTSGLICWKSDPERMKIQINNSQITNMDGNLMMAIDCHVEAVNSEFSNSTGATVALIGGIYQFTHCTIANYKKIGKPYRDPLTRTLMLSNVVKKEKEEPTYHALKQAYFDNCIIDGSNSADSTKLYKGEIVFLTSAESDIRGNDEIFNYRFNSCFIKTARVTNNDRFINDLYIYPPTYLKTGKEEEGLEFDYRLKNESVGIGKADRTISEKYPVDRYGVNRLTSEYGPSIGAYEYVYQEEEDKK